MAVDPTPAMLLPPTVRAVQFRNGLKIGHFTFPAGQTDINLQGIFAERGSLLLAVATNLNVQAYLKGSARNRSDGWVAFGTAVTPQSMEAREAGAEEAPGADEVDEKAERERAKDARRADRDEKLGAPKHRDKAD